MKAFRYLLLVLFLCAANSLIAAPKGFPAKVKSQPAADETADTSATEMKSEDVSATTVDEDAASEDGEEDAKRSWFRFGKKDEEAAAAAAEAQGPVFHFPKSLEGIDFTVTPSGVVADDPWRQLWGSADFQRSFMGRYGFHPNVEP